MTIEEKARAYDEARERAEKIYNSEFKPDEAVVLSKYLLILFPELKEDNNDERIRKGIIRNLQYLMDRSEGFVKEDLQEKIVWLENQAKQSTDKIEQNPAWSEEDEEMLTWLCRIIHSQRLDRAITLKEESELGEWIDKWLNYNSQTKQCEHLENNDEEERIRKGLIKAVSRIFEGHKLFDTDVTREEALAWLEKQAEPNPYSGVSFKYNSHIWGMCARDNGVEILFDGELKAFLSVEKSFIYPIYPKPDLAHKSDIEVIKENIGNNKVEPKFHPGDWVIDNIGDIYQIEKATEIESEHIFGYTVVGGGYFNDNNNSVRLWTINDAKNGDVLVNSTGQPFIFSGKYDDIHFGSPIAYCGVNCENKFKIGNGTHWTSKDGVVPATKEQRELLFEKMKQEGYKWDAENKRLSKQPLKITPKFCVGQLITDDNGTWYRIIKIKCLDDWYYEVYDACEDTTHLELCSIIDEKFRKNRFVDEIKKMMGD